MTEKGKLSPIEVYNSLSEHTREMCPFITIRGDKEMLEATFPKDLGYDLDNMLREGLSSGVVEKITLIDELRQKLAKLSPQKPITGQIKPTEEEIQYSSLKRQIEDYEKDPESFKSWNKEEYRVAEQFLPVVPDIS